MSTDTSPSISVVMVDGSFRERFHALTSLRDQSLPIDRYEIIWVEFFNDVRPDLAAEIEATPNATLITLGRTGTYHSSHCFNAGIQAAKGELIVIPDADVVVEHDFLERLGTLHAANERLVTYCYRFNEVEQAGSGDVSIGHLKSVCILTHPSNWGGCVAVRKKWLLEVNGYEMHPLFETGDHGNDFDMYIRFKNLGLDVSWPREPVIYHPWHPSTLVYAYTHKLQAILTRHRAVTREYLAYHGIDDSERREISDVVMQRIDSARTEFERGEAAHSDSSDSPPLLISDSD